MSSDSEPEELLMATRSRRANAGNKMQKLLQQELEDVQKQTSMLGDDEINLLFQEDEEDEEFTFESKKRLEDEDMFSDSGDELSEASDADEGEKELQKQERQKRKLIQKKKSRVPVIKRPKKAPVDKISKSTIDEINAESLLTESRRTSKRSAVVANKLKVYENLTQAEKRRKIIQEKLRKQREKQSLKPLTQEEQLKVAEETERINVSSLNKYKEQELSKKQTRLAMQLREKMKFKDGEHIIRWLSTQWEVSPLVELEDRAYWELYTSKRDKTKKKYVRRRKAQIEEDNLREENKANTANENEKESSVDVINKSETIPNAENELTASSENSSREDSSCPPIVMSTPERENEIQEETSAKVDVENNTVTTDTPTLDKSLKEASSTESPTAALSVETIESVERTQFGSQEDDCKQICTESPTLSSAESRSNDKIVLKEAADISNQNIETVKHITFAETDQISLINSEDPPIFVQSSMEATDLVESGELGEKVEVKEDSEEKVDDVLEELEPTYEGPVQRVGKNFVILYTFPDHPIATQNSEVRKIILGKNWVLPSKARPDELETLMKITSSEEQEPLQSILIPDMSILDKFPRFGEFNKKTLRTVTIDTTKKDKIEIRTEAPTGVFLPNGIRKNCLITNRECKYFDPKNGVPYSDVEAIKTIQLLQEYYDDNGEPIEPKFKWYGFGRGGIYLDVHQKPASGVPEGFV